MNRRILKKVIEAIQILFFTQGRRKKMEVKYYVCNHCGNIIEMVKDKGVPVADFCLCDGEQVEEVYAYCNLHGLWKC